MTEKEKSIWFLKYLKSKGRSIYTRCEIENDVSAFLKRLLTFSQVNASSTQTECLLDEDDCKEVGRIDPIARRRRTFMGVFEVVNHLSMHERRLAMKKSHQRKQWIDQNCDPDNNE